MAKGKKDFSTQLAEKVSMAERAVIKMADPELRRIAFDRILEHLLRTHPEELASPEPARARVAKVNKVEDGSTKPGPKAWIRELADDDFFKNPKTNAAIRIALDERGHILKASDLTQPLADLVTEKMLRRKKMVPEEGGKSQLHWHNW